jgi:hypothetical protein
LTPKTHTYVYKNWKCFFKNFEGRGYRYQLGFDRSSTNSTNETVFRLRVLEADAENLREMHNLDDAKFWDPEWGCSEEKHWYTDPKRLL